MGHKRITAILFALVLFLCMSGIFAACGKSPDTPPYVPPADESTEFIESSKVVNATKLVTYDGPTVMQSSKKVSMAVEGQDVFVYDTRVNHQRVFTWNTAYPEAQVAIFDFEGTVSVSVTVDSMYYDIKDVTLRPLAYGVTPVLSGNTITFNLKYTDNYILEYACKYDLNGKTFEEPAYRNALHIFTNPIETDAVDPQNIPDDMFYIGPGVYKAGAIPVTDGMTVYIAGGAVVYGQFRAEGVKNLTVRGRGILSGSVFARTRDSEFTLPFEMRECSGFKLEDITILDPAGWAVTLLKCEDVEINNLKIITARPNGDGISVQSSKDVRVNGGFVRTWDDALVVKAVDGQPTENILFEGVTVWTDLAQSMEVGYEAKGPYIKNVTFSNITVVHNFHKAVISIHNADIAAISDITYKNITVEDGRMLGDAQADGLNDYLIDFGIAYHADWGKDSPYRGAVSNVKIENVKVLYLEPSVVCRMEGENAAASINNVTITDIMIQGNHAATLADIKLSPGAFTSNITLSRLAEKVTGAHVRLPYNNQVPANYTPAVTRVSTNTQQKGVEVPEFAIIKAEPTYMGVPMVLGSGAVRATRFASDRGASDFEDETGLFEASGYPAANLLDGDRSTVWRAGEWKNIENEFAALTFTFAPVKDGGFSENDKVTPGVVRVYLTEDSPYVYEYNIRVTVNTGTEPNKVANMISPRIYTATPAAGNYFDIVLSGIPCYQLQLRFYRTEGIFAQNPLEIADIEFLPQSLSTGKAIVGSSDNADVYNVGNIVDGYNATYYEASAIGYAFVVIDLGAEYNFSVINLHLPPSLLWEPRKQEIAILGSSASSYGANTQFSVICERAEYLFDAAAGNVISLTLDAPASARYVKLEWFSNKNLTGGEFSENFGGQLSEIYIY